MNPEDKSTTDLLCDLRGGPGPLCESSGSYIEDRSVLLEGPKLPGLVAIGTCYLEGFSKKHGSSNTYLERFLRAWN